MGVGLLRSFVRLLTIRWCFVRILLLYRRMTPPVRTGGRLPVAVVLVLGFSNIFADALSMGVGEYLSSKVRPVHVSAEAYRYNIDLLRARTKVCIPWSLLPLCRQRPRTVGTSSVRHGLQGNCQEMVVPKKNVVLKHILAGNGQRKNVSRFTALGSGSQRIRHGREETGRVGAQEPPGRRNLGDGRHFRGVWLLKLVDTTLPVGEG